MAIVISVFSMFIFSKAKMWEKMFTHTTQVGFKTDTIILEVNLQYILNLLAYVL